MSNGYEYDVFLSYIHERPCGPWVEEHFLPYFIPQLSNALGGRRASVFFDRTGIHSGQKWPERLKQALSLSRCLVGIWSPMYFHSEWCQIESAIMLNRERKVRPATTANPEGLIVGIKVNDGIHFPNYAKNIQRADFEPYFVDCPGFNQSALHVDFEKAIVPLTLDVARVIENAPNWSPDWLGANWTDDIIASIKKPPPAKVAQPLLS